MTKSLNVAVGLYLPRDAITQTFAVLAKRRVGKTYTASVVARMTPIQWVAVGVLLLSVSAIVCSIFFLIGDE